MKPQVVRNSVAQDSPKLANPGSETIQLPAVEDVFLAADNYWNGQ
jgi:hypothetical protein